MSKNLRPLAARRALRARCHLVSNAIVFFLCALKLGTVSHRPRVERLKRLLKRVPKWGYGIFNPDRRFRRKYLTANETIALQTLQRICERFVCDPVKAPHDLVEA